MHMSPELWFHLVEIVVLVFGIAAPLLWCMVRLYSVLKDNPPHRHLNGKILYPKGFEPPEVEVLAYDKRS